MDKVVDSGSTDAGSIPVRDAKSLNTSIHADAGVYIFQSFHVGFKVSTDFKSSHFR